MSGLGSGEVRDALAWIRAHVPAQLFTDADASVPPPVVDLVVRSERGRLVVDVVPGPWSGLRVADSYVAAAGDPFVAREVARAQRFVDGLTRRAATLLDVAEVAVVRQTRRVREGPRGHVPLRRREVAAELGVHESTVSRAVVGKHLLLPSGETVAFASLFGASVGVEHCLCDIVGAETVPLSDIELADALAARGHRVARRTVAKYRSALGIPAKHHR
jgi:RNA polymerase sigma-54 factor